MKHIVAVWILALSVLIGLSCERTRTDNGLNTQAGPEVQATTKADDGQTPLPKDEPLLLEDAPLLLADEGGAGNTSGGDLLLHEIGMADVTSAIVRAAGHAKVGIGCARCHGECDEHIADESWASGGNGTAPDTMFPRDMIPMFCLGCHTASTLTGSQHQGIAEGTSEKVCTDCHGKHRLVARKCKWK